MKSFFSPLLKEFFLLSILSIAAYLMLSSIIQYYPLEDTTAFLKQKQEYIHISVWKISFYIHVFSSMLTLIAGFTQFSNYILTHHRAIHRLMGKVYVWSVLVINFPTGFIMAIYANGYWPSKMAFLILDCLWFYFTIKALIAIKNKKIGEHKNYMIRSYALTFSAITLRTWKIILSSVFVIDNMTLYMIDAWLGFVPNLLVAEWLIRKKNKRSASKIHIHQNNDSNGEK